jgi:hypothetical protein
VETRTTALKRSIHAMPMDPSPEPDSAFTTGICGSPWRRWSRLCHAKRVYFLAGAFLAAGFLAAGFLAGAFLAAGFLAAGFLTAGFLAGAFLAAGFLAC